LTVRPGRVLTLAGPEVGAEKMRLRLPIRGPRLSSVSDATPSPGGPPAAAFLPAALIAPPRGHRRRHHRCPARTRGDSPRNAPRRPAGTAAPAPAPQHCGGGTRRSRKSGGAIPRGEFRPCVLVAARPLEHFEPGAHGAARHLLLAAAPNAYERKPISGVQRRRRPDRQACVAHIAPRSRTR